MDTRADGRDQEGSGVPRLLKISQVCERLQIHPSTWRRAVRAGLAPAPITIPVGFGRTPQAHRWTEDSIRKFVLDRSDEKDDTREALS